MQESFFSIDNTHALCSFASSLCASEFKSDFLELLRRRFGKFTHQRLCLLALFLYGRAAVEDFKGHLCAMVLC